ncbi:MAG: protein kinase [Planctomycetaceae bacterium]|nr:protein kinase [Planctomycetaceae bacterium]
MRVRCPHCHSPLEIVADEAVAEVICPSCGSSLAGVNETLISITPETRLLGHFQLVECVGRGYFGEVWKARDTDLRRTVAIKIPRTQDLTEEIRERFHREAKTTAQLRHPNIVPVHEVGRDAETIFIVSDFIDGMTLAERIALDRPAPREAAELCSTLALALHYAHEAGVIHRDIKPSNIMLDREKKPYLMDFGLAKQEAGEFTMTASGDILGTPAYMPPEQARGESHLADRRSDVYSLGVILYELLTGERPFKGSTHLLIKAILNVEPQPPSKITRNLPRDLETICLKAMSKEPHRRYATALDFAEDLQRYLRGESIIARRASFVEHGWRWIRRNPAISAASGIAMMATLGLIVSLGGKPTTDIPRRTVTIDTVPTGATVVFYPLSPDNGEPLLDQAIVPPEQAPVTVSLEPGDYLVQAVTEAAGYTFHQVYRRVPSRSGISYSQPHLSWNVNKDGSVQLHEIKLPPSTVTDGMVEFAGADNFTARDGSLDDAPPFQQSVQPFVMDVTEVTVGQIKAWMAKEQTTAPPMPFHFMPKEGLTDDHPLTHVAYDDAVAIAEKLGKRIPTEFEFEFAATNGGQTRFPWGDGEQEIKDWQFGPVSTTATWDRTPTQPVVTGLYSNLLEWTTAWAKPYPIGQMAGVKFEPLIDQRIVRGGSQSVLDGKSKAEDWIRGPRNRVPVNRVTFNPNLGFRCVRSARPK